MKQQKRHVGLAIFILTALLFGLSSDHATVSQTDASTFVVGTPYEFATFNVFKQSNIDARWMSAIFAGIYERDPASNRTYVPVLAQTMPKVQEVNDPDGTKMVVTVKLKQGLKFSNGYPLTADDIVYTFQLHMIPEIGSIERGGLSAYLQANGFVRAVDDATVEFRFKDKYAFYLRFVSLPILPQEVYQQAVDSGIYDFSADPMTYLIGAGPFMLESIDNNNVVTLVRNPNWQTTYLPEPKVDRLVFKKIATKGEAVAELQKGAVNLLDADYIFNLGEITTQGIVEEIIPSFNLQEMALNHIHPVWGHTAQLDAFIGQTFTYSSTGLNYTVRSFWDEISGGNMTEAERVEAARLVREAISHAVPREEIVNTILGGVGYSLATPMPIAAIGRDPSIQPRNYSIATAGRLIQKAFALAGWTNIITSTDDNQTGIYFGDLMNYFPDWAITLLSLLTNPYRNQWVALMETRFPLIGINVTKNVRTDWWVILPRTFGMTISSNEYNLPNGLHTPIPLWDQQGYDLLFFGYQWTGEFGWDPQGLWETWAWLPVGGNFYNYWDPNYDELTESYIQETSYSLRLEKAKHIQDYLYDYQPTIPIVSPSKVWVYWEKGYGIDLALYQVGKYPWWRLGSLDDPLPTTFPSLDTKPNSSTQSPSPEEFNNTTGEAPFPLRFNTFYTGMGGLVLAIITMTRKKNKR